MRGGVNPRARTREDRAGDPLDGLVNLFDLGIVLSVAFLLAALSSLDLTTELFRNESAQAQRAPDGSVVVKPGEESRSIELQPGARVVGRGEPVGTVYRLDDGRTIIVQPKDETGTSGTTDPDTPSSSDGSTGSSPSGDAGSTGGSSGSSTGSGSNDDDEPTLGDPATDDGSTGGSSTGGGSTGSGSTGNSTSGQDLLDSFSDDRP